MFVVLLIIATTNHAKTKEVATTQHRKHMLLNGMRIQHLPRCTLVSPSASTDPSKRTTVQPVTIVTANARARGRNATAIAINIFDSGAAVTAFPTKPAQQGVTQPAAAALQRSAALQRARVAVNQAADQAYYDWVVAWLFSG